MKKLSKYSFGMGDRFAHQAKYHLQAITNAASKGIDVTPVWNKSNREHTTIGSKPADTLKAVEEAIKAKSYSHQYFIDADHINLQTVEGFLDYANFFTIDVASYIGTKADEKEKDNFLKTVEKYITNLEVPGITEKFEISKSYVEELIDTYLYAAEMANKTYKIIEDAKGKGNFITEVSMDEVENPQKPSDLFFILAMLAFYNVPVQTIAPKFTGRFNKGVDYVGDVSAFRQEFEDNLMVIDFAVKEFNLPEELKISIHSGSDKFSIYPAIKEMTQKHDKGFHIKTAGTTWLEEVIGLAKAGGDALKLVKEIYAESLTDIDGLAAPYADVIDINKEELPTAEVTNSWSGQDFVDALLHIPNSEKFNPNMRQLIHVGYKLAADRIEEFNKQIIENKDVVGQCVYENIYDRHLKRLFEF